MLRTRRTISQRIIIKRHSYVSACQKSRGLEYLLVQDAVWNEIAKGEDALELTHVKTGISAQLKEERSLDRHRGGKDAMLLFLPTGGRDTRQNRLNGSHKKLNTFPSFALLPGSVASEMPYFVIDPRVVAKATSDGKAALRATHEAHKLRRARGNRLDGFLFVHKNETCRKAMKVQEKVDENLNASVFKRNTATKGILRPALPNVRERSRNSAADSTVSLKITGLDTMEDTLENTLNGAVKGSKVT
ncbi:putative axoneme central apparatus protein [Trypanosoma rangeli]|uniref:Putative axoneme central apparatus protein n=1 Tax=Trypanosoma rangeli TaxID=5698 RepID=A0A422NXM0_TRYRA|nr:putative axoneme central apparatus protein [Trypanosoma rangeli]RNF10165.1 putative axoneme central apparatus protein [Trypanosoma rangeli]|eukprot:RNF10165.1 putative axoneme central apparatus protein [Trypanosoma rangeli]